MSATTYFENIQKYLYQYSDIISSSNALGLTDKTINAENIFIEFLNLAFGWNLKNANAISVNQDSFDLVDKRRRIYIQVTSNKNHSTKRKGAVASFLKGNTSKTKQRFIVLFISRQCSDKVLKEVTEQNITHQGYDIPKLLKELYYKNVNPSQLKKITQLLQEVVQPVLIQFETDTVKTSIDFIEQSVTLIKEDLYIKRTQLIEQVFNFIQQDNGLLIGGHGYGKSFTLEELQRHCQSKDIPCIIIRINDLLNGSDEDISKELKVNGNWLKAFSSHKLPKAIFKAVLIFDAFDTAKDPQLKQAILKQIKAAIKTLNPNWHVFVSVRSFDASKSPQLHEMFSIGNMKNIISCRHFEIPKLSFTELTDAASKDSKVYAVFQKVRPELKELLRIPYFFHLLVQSLQNSDDITLADIISIETEEQLLSFYWNTKAGDTTAKDVFLHRLTTLLVDKESLSIEKASILTDANSHVFDELGSKGVIAEVSTTGKRIAYTHNILLDFAISRFLIPEDSEELISFIKANERMPFIFRQGFIYFYSRLWQDNRENFWKHYAKVNEEASPLFILYHQMILNYVVADFYRTSTDLTPLFNETAADKKGQVLKKLLEAVRFITKGDVRDKDINLLHAISENIHWAFLWELGLQLDVAIKKLQEENNIKNKHWKVLSVAAYNYWRYVLNGRKAPSQYKGIIDNNGGMWGMDNLCATHFINKSAVQKLIKETLSLLKDEDFPIRPFLLLADHIIKLFLVDQKFAIEVYKKLYYHNENSNKETYFGGATMPLRSNRSQDYHLIHYKLEKDFTELLSLDPINVLPLGIEMINRFSKDSYSNPYSNKQHHLTVNSIDAYFTLNGRYEDIVDDEDHGPQSYGVNIFKLYSKYAEERKKKVLVNLVNIFIEQAHTCNAWRRFIRFLTQFPKLLCDTAYSLLCNDVIFMCSETTEEAGALITALWPYLSVTKRRKIETIILNLRELQQDESSIKYQNIRISRLLNCIPKGMVTLEVSNKFISSHTPVINQPTLNGIVAANIVSLSREEEIGITGLNPQIKEDVEAFNELQKLEAFNAKLSNKEIKPTRPDHLEIFPMLEEFFKKTQNEKWPNDQIRFTYDYAIGKAINVLSKSTIKFNKAVNNFLLKLVFFYLDHPIYKPTQYSPGEAGVGARSISPGPRIEAAKAITHLLYSDKSEQLPSSVLTLIEDNDSLVRYYALNAITWYWHHDRPSFWAKIVQRASCEQDGMCLYEIIRAVSYSNIMSENVEAVETVAEILLPRLSTLNEIRTSNLWSSYTALLLKLRIEHDSKNAEILIQENLHNKEFSRQLIRKIAMAIDPRNDKNNYFTEPDTYHCLLLIFSNIIDYRFDAIELKGLTSSDLKDDFEIIDKCIQELYFVFAIGRGNDKDKRLTLENKAAFFRAVKPILNKVVNRSTGIGSGFMVAHTGYYFMQLLNHTFLFDERHILSLAFNIVNCAADNGFSYDQSCLREIIKMTEMILTDHKYLLSEKESFNSLLTILVQFANSGWQEALELTWRLKDAF